MVIYIENKKGEEVIRIQEIDEEHGDLRIGVWDEVKGSLIKIFPYEEGSCKKAEDFGDEYLKENYEEN